MSGKVERDAFESMVCDRLEAYEPQPPMHVWTKLESHLDGKEIEDKKNRIWLPWASAAAVVVMSVGLTLQTTHPGLFKLSCQDDSFVQKPVEKETQQKVGRGLAENSKNSHQIAPSKGNPVSSSPQISAKTPNKVHHTAVLASLPVEGNPINVASISSHSSPSVLDKIQVPTELISQMNLKEKNLIGAKDESSVVEMTQQEFLELLRKNGYLNQEIPINQVVAQNPPIQPEKKNGRDIKKFVLKQLGNAQLIQLNEQGPNRIQYQLSTPVIQVSGNVH